MSHDCGIWLAVSTAPIEQMRKLHQQAMQQARVEQKFASKPKAWLDWDAVCAARAKAVREYEHAEAEGGEEGSPLRRRLFDATLLTWLTSVPPDRVGVTRQLRLGVTLKPSESGEVGGWDLDLATPDAHKTAAAFGPSRTAVPAATAKLLSAWLSLAGLDTASGASQQPYVFVPSASTATGHSKPIAAKRWTEVVQASFARHAGGVRLAPKDLRSSYVTWLRSASNSDEALRAAARAMRHSTHQQASAAYDKGAAARLSKAAVAQAQKHAARFA